MLLEIERPELQPEEAEFDSTTKRTWGGYYARLEI